MGWTSESWFIAELVFYALLLAHRAVTAIKRARAELREFEAQLFGSIEE